MVAQSKLLNPISIEDILDKRYVNGKIYIVRNRYDDNLIYIGSTIDTLERRFGKHFKDIKNSLYQYVNNDWDNWYIELYEDYPCKNKYELRRREGQVQKQIATINKNIAGRTEKEYLQDNRDKILENMKKYYQDNRDKHLEYRKQYLICNKEKIHEKDRQRYENNRDKILEREKNKYQKNKDIISQKNKEKIICDHCGSIVRKVDIVRHQRTNKCINFKPN